MSVDSTEPAFEAERAANLANWDERVAGHIAPDGYDVAGLLAAPDRLTAVVRHDAALLGDVDGLDLLHLQCHIGTDTLSWARLGATATGVDFSPKALEAARRFAADAHVDITYVECDLYDAPSHVAGDFDLVYTSVGTICWLPDIRAWAEVAAGFVRPGGRFFIRDGHPMLYALDDDRTDGVYAVRYDYLDRPQPNRFDQSTSYEGSTTLQHSVHFEWTHSLTAVIQALIDAGLRIDRVAEYDFLDWPFFPWMERDGDVYRLPESERHRVPLQFSIEASKPLD